MSTTSREPVGLALNSLILSPLATVAKLSLNYSLTRCSAREYVGALRLAFEWHFRSLEIISVTVVGLLCL